LLLIQFLHFYRQQVTQTSQIPKNIWSQCLEWSLILL
jgi:hypothetical protein